MICSQIRGTRFKETQVKNELFIKKQWSVRRKMLNRKVPVVTFKTRVRDESLGGDNPYKWENKTSSDYFLEASFTSIWLPSDSEQIARSVPVGVPSER